MALNTVSLVFGYYPDPTQGRPVFNGSIFIGEPDLDPTILANQKTITIRQEGVDTPSVTQPISTSAGGIPVFNGSPAEILVDGEYSLAVLNSQGSQVYYVASIDAPADADDNQASDKRYGPIFATVAAMTAANPVSLDGTIVDLTVGMPVAIDDYATGNDSGIIFGRIVATATGTADGGSYIDLNNGLQFEQNFPSVIRAEMFGVIDDYVPNSSLGTDQSVKLNAAISFAKSAGFSSVAVKPGYHNISTETVNIPSGVSLVCEDATGFLDDDNKSSGSHCWFVLVGTGPKAHSITDDDLGGGFEMGGQIANPSNGQSYAASHGTRSDFYRVLDFTNGDASGATKATAKTFSVGVKIADSNGLHGIMITNNASGDVAHNFSGADFGDDWDVGLWCLNSDRSQVSKVSSWGYFRMAALLFTNIAVGGATGQAERAEFSNCSFRGYRGVALRSTTGHTSTAATATTLEIAFSISHRWDTSGDFQLGTSGTVHTYSGLTFAGDKLTFTGVSPDPSAGFTVGDEVSFNKPNFGLSNTLFSHCHIGDMVHESGRFCVDDFFAGNAFNFQASALEISGRHVRQPMFTDCIIHSREDGGVFIHDGRDVVFSGGYMESRSAVNDVGASIDRGTRFLALKEDSALHSASFVTKGARQIYIDSSMLFAQTQFLPAFNINNGANTKFGNANGLCDPQDTWLGQFHLGLENEDGIGATNAFRFGWHPTAKNAETGFDGRVSLFRDDATDSAVYPIGQILSVFAGSSTNRPDRRASQNIFIDVVNSYRYTIFSNSGANTAINGTWRSSGETGEDAAGNVFFLFERTA